MYKSRDRLVAAVFALLLAVAAINPSSADGGRHRVSLGQTLWEIARLYSVTVDGLVQLNHIANPDLILVGQLLEVPGLGHQAPQQAAPAAGLEYVVQPGDTLSGIALRFNVSTASVQSANGLTNPDMIIAGQRLVIPGPQPVAPPITTPLLPPISPELETIIDRFAAAEGVNPRLVRAVAWVESGWQQDALSPAGAVGVMQITPLTAAWLEEEVFGEPLNEDTSVYDNVKIGTRLLRLLLDATGSTELALAAYYQGLGAIQSGVPYDETGQYVRTVLAVQATYWP